MDDIQSQKVVLFAKQYNFLMLEFTKLLLLGKDVLEDLYANKMIDGEESDGRDYEKFLEVLQTITKSAEMLVSIADFDKNL